MNDQDRITQLEASHAAMREAVVKVKDELYSNSHPEQFQYELEILKYALSADAGKSLLDRLQAVEKERDACLNRLSENDTEIMQLRDERDRLLTENKSLKEKYESR